MRRLNGLICFCLITIAATHTTVLHAQIRPLDPAPWRVFDGDNNVLLDAGVGMLYGQRASLAGTQGRLEELGLYDIVWRNGRVAIHATGTALWSLKNEEVFRTAHSEVGLEHDDPGAVIVESLARLSPDNAPVLWLLRFGTRLPVTSLVSGLDRDATDFFALLGLRTQGDLWVAGEAGTSINGRPWPARGQTDAFAFTAGAGYRSARIPVESEVWIVGHDNLHGIEYRANEDLRELRVGLRTRGRYWLGVHWIHGLGDYSPSNGFRIMTGIDAHVRRVPILGWE
ncbi:MAG: hypothetical protein ABIS27_08410 [Longimicrobiales bacterium]